MKSASFAGVVSISNPKKSEAFETPRNNRVYCINEITSDSILDKIGDENCYGEDAIHVSTHSSDTAAENTSDGYLLTPEQAESSKSVSKLASMESEAVAKCQAMISVKSGRSVLGIVTLCVLLCGFLAYRTMYCSQLLDLG